MSDKITRPWASSPRRSRAEPWKIKMVEPLRMNAARGPRAALARPAANTFLLRSDDVYIDLLTDAAQRDDDRQWAGMMSRRG